MVCAVRSIIQRLFVGSLVPPLVVSVQGVHGRRVQEAAEAMIEDLQLQDKRNSPAKILSGGMKRKLR